MSAQSQGFPATDTLGAGSVGLGRCVLFRVTEHIRDSGFWVPEAGGALAHIAHWPSSPHQYSSPRVFHTYCNLCGNHEKSEDSSLPSHFIHEKIGDGGWGAIGFLDSPREEAILGNRPPSC